MGRPRILDDLAETVIRVRVTRSEWRDLKQVAAENRTCVSVAIREAVNEYVSDYRESGPVFRRTKLQP